MACKFFGGNGYTLKTNVLEKYFVGRGGGWDVIYSVVFIFLKLESQDISCVLCGKKTFILFAHVYTLYLSKDNQMSDIILQQWPKL